MDFCRRFLLANALKTSFWNSFELHILLTLGIHTHLPRLVSLSVSVGSWLGSSTLSPNQSELVRARVWMVHSVKIVPTRLGSPALRPVSVFCTRVKGGDCRVRVAYLVGTKPLTSTGGSVDETARLVQVVILVIALSIISELHNAVNRFPTARVFRVKKCW